jgi:hypothetical protein
MVALHVKFGVALLTSSSCVLSSYYHPSLSFSPDLTFSSSVPPVEFSRLPTSSLVELWRTQISLHDRIICRPCRAFLIQLLHGRVESRADVLGKEDARCTQPRGGRTRGREREPECFNNPPCDVLSTAFP